jgi:hypothetical protein
MTTLTLIESEQQPKPKDWRIERISYWRLRHKEYVGREARLGYGAMMNMLETLWLKHHGYTDNTTGEIIFDIPPIEDWTEETDNFFKDKWAGENCGYHFGYFIKGYGGFTKYAPEKREPSDPILRHTCKRCGSIMKYKTSKWVQHKNKIGKCASCDERFNVNDVLNQIPELTDLI